MHSRKKMNRGKSVLTERVLPENSMLPVAPMHILRIYLDH